MNPLTCKRCEHQGYYVQSRIVLVADPKPVTYTGLKHPVLEHYRREARCIDKEACDERYEAVREMA